jgi:hypothetical protein
MTAVAAAAIRGNRMGFIYEIWKKADKFGTFQVYNPSKVRVFGFIDSNCHLLVNLRLERRPEAGA